MKTIVPITQAGIFLYQELPDDSGVPDGWTEVSDQQRRSDAAAWAAKYVPPAEVPVVRSREDYKAALDAMLSEQCRGYEFDGIQTLALYLFDPANKFHARALWLARLNVFTWQTSDDMAANPPAGTQPTPTELAAYILAQFEASNPRPV